MVEVWAGQTNKTSDAVSDICDRSPLVTVVSLTDATAANWATRAEPENGLEKNQHLRLTHFQRKHFIISVNLPIFLNCSFVFFSFLLSSCTSWPPSHLFLLLLPLLPYLPLPPSFPPSLQDGQGSSQNTIWTFKTFYSSAGLTPSGSAASCWRNNLDSVLRLEDLL